MLQSLHRRQILKAAAGGTLAAALPLAACGGPEAGALASTKLTDTMALIPASGGNVFAARAGDSLVVVDGGFAEESAGVLAAVRNSLGRGPVTTLVNTHWHRGATGANETLGKQGVKIFAHENTKQWLAHEVFVRWENKTYEPLPAEALPTETFYSTGVMPFGDGEIAYGHLLMAHTDGDMYVHFPAENVLVAGGAVSNDAWPLIDWGTGGWIGGLLDGYETLLEISNDETVIVPGSGPTLMKPELQSQYEMYGQIFDRLNTLLKDSMSPVEAVAARPADGFKPEWGSPDQFVELAFRSFYGHLRGDPRVGAMP